MRKVVIQRPGACGELRAGGVGGALLQLLRIAGCFSVGVVGAGHKVASARALGADVVIDKSGEATQVSPVAAAQGPPGWE